MGSSGGSKSIKVENKRKIPKPTWEERRLLRNLYDISESGYYQPSQEFLSELSTHYTPSEEFMAEMRNPYLSMLPFQEKVGETLNTLAQRGVLGGSVAQNALDQLGRWALERGQELRFRGLTAAEAALREAMADELKRAMLAEEAQKQSIEDHYRQMFNIWSTLYGGRMGTSTGTIQTEPAPPSEFGAALGTGLGYVGSGLLGKGLVGLGKWAFESLNPFSGPFI